MPLITSSRQRLGGVQLPKTAIVAIIAVLITAFLVLIVGLCCVLRRTLKNTRNDTEMNADASMNGTPSHPSQIPNAV